MQNQNQKIKFNFKIVVMSLCLVLLCAGCTQYTHYYEQKHRENTTYVIQKQALEPFNRIVVNGKAKATVTYAKNSTAFLSGQKQHVINVHISVVNKTLYIYAPDGKNTNIAIHTNSVVNNITLEDNAVFVAENLSNSNLTLNLYGNATCVLDGEYSVNKIVQNSSQKIELKWIHGDNLNIEAHGKGHVYLAGQINNLQILATNHAKIDTHYLQAQNASIFTKDRAIVNVYAINNLQAFADEKSLIAYFIRPTFLNKVTQKQGNVLYFGLNTNIMQK